MTPPVPLRRLAALCLVAAVLTGCGDDASTSGGDTGASSSPSSSASSTPAVCADLAALQKSVQGLKGTSLDQGALSKISAELGTIQQQLEQLRSDAKDQYSSEINQVSSTLATLSTSVDAAAQNPTSSTLATVASSLRAVGTAAKGLQSAVASSC